MDKVIDETKRAEVGLFNPSTTEYKDGRNLKGTMLTANWGVPIPVDKKNFYHVVIYKDVEGVIRFIRVLERDMTKLDEELHPDPENLNAVFERMKKRIARKIQDNKK